MAQPLFSIPTSNPAAAPTPTAAPQDIAPAAPMVAPPDTRPAAAVTELDVAQGATQASEPEAFKALHMLRENRRNPGMLSPEKESTLRGQLQSYVEVQRAHNRPLFPEQATVHRAAQVKRATAMLGGLDKLSEALPADKFAELESRAKLSPDPDGYRARVVNRNFLDLAYGKKVLPEHYEKARDYYAKKVLKIEGPLDDKGFYGALQARQQKQRATDEHLTRSLEDVFARVAAGESPDVKPLLADLRKTMPDIDESVAESYEDELRLARRQYRELRRQVEPLADALSAFVMRRANRADAIPSGGFGTETPEPKAEWEAAQRFNALSPEQQAMVGAIIEKRIESMPEDQRGVFSRAFAGFNQAEYRMWQGVADWIAGQAKALGQWTKDEDRLGFLNAVRRGDVKTAFFGSQDPRSADEKRAGLRLRNLSSMAGRVVKPTDNWFVRAGILFSEQLPYTAAMFMPGGTALLATSMAGNSYSDALLNRPDADPAKQLGMATLSGAAQATIERASFGFMRNIYRGNSNFLKFLTGKYGTASVLNLAKVTDKFARAAVGGAVGVAGVTAVEYGEEIAQDVTDAALQDLATELSGLDSTTDYGALLRSWDPRGEKGRDTVLALLPLALIGGAGASVRHFKHGGWLMKKREALEAVGVSPEKAREIAMEPDLSTAEPMFKEEFAQNFDAQRQKAAADAFAEYLQDARELARAAGYELIEEDQGFTDDQPSRWLLRLPNEQFSYHASQEEAEQALLEAQRTEIEAAQDASVEALTVSMVDFLKEEGRTGQDVQVNEQEFAGTFDELIRRGMATMEQVQKRLEIYAMEQGRSVESVQADVRSGRLNLRIMARAYSQELVNGSKKYFVDLFQGADPLNAVEDFAENHWSMLLDNQLIDAPTVIGWLRATEYATGNTYLDAGITPQSYRHADHRMNLIEALSKASIQYLMAESRSDQLPEGFRGWIEQMVLALGKAWNWAKELLKSQKLRQAIEDGQIPQRFVDELADSVGLNDRAREQRGIKQMQEQAMAEMLAEFPKLSDRIKGKLMHPETARQENSPFAGELRRIFDHFVSTKRVRKWNKKGQLSESTRENVRTANAFFAPAGTYVDLDRLRESLAEEGFPGMETVSDMLRMVEEVVAIDKVEYYATHGGLLASSFSLGVDSSATMAGMTGSNEDAASENRDGGNQVADATQSVLNVSGMTVSEFSQVVNNFYKSPASISGAVQNIARMLKRAGARFMMDDSRKSQSQYINILKDTGEDLDTVHKIRISDHELPDKYAQDWDSQVYVNWTSRTQALNRFGSDHWFFAVVNGLAAADLKLAEKDQKEFADHLAEQRTANAATAARQAAANAARASMQQSEEQLKLSAAEWAKSNMVPTWEKIQRLESALEEKDDYGMSTISGQKRREVKHELKSSWNKLVSAYQQSNPSNPSFSLSAVTGSPIATLFSLGVSNEKGDTVSSVSLPKSFDSIDANNRVSIRADVATGDVPTRADGSNVTFSLATARENYESAKNKLQQARQNLIDVEAVTAAQKTEWIRKHGSIGTLLDVAGYGYKNGSSRILGGSMLDYALFDIKSKKQFPDNSDFLISKNRQIITKLMDGDTVIAENSKYDLAPFPESQELINARAALIDAEAEIFLASLDYDPEKDARIARSEQMLEEESIRRIAAYNAMLDARSKEEAKQAKSFVARLWNAYAQHDDIFQYGRTTSKNADDIAEAVSTPSSPIAVEKYGSTLKFISKKGYLEIEKINTPRPYISSPNAGSQGQKKQGGSQLYMAALDWIHNNKKRIKDDPKGITGINMMRRTSNFLASAIRWGTTKHLKPHDGQKVGKWSKSDSLNISLLATKEMENVFNILPLGKSLRFDFASGNFQDTDGNIQTTEDLESLIDSNNTGGEGVGISTLQRAIITASAIQEFQRGTSETIVEQAESNLPSEIAGVTYSLSAVTGSPIATLLEQKATQGPQERATIMEGIRTRLQAVQYKREARESGMMSVMERQLQGWRARTDLTPEQRERLRIEDAMAEVKAVLNAVPAEIRGKITVPMNRILDADTEKTTSNAFAELIENLDDVLEQQLRADYTEAISNILDIAQPTISETKQQKGKLIVETNKLIKRITEIQDMAAIVLAAELSTSETRIAELEQALSEADESNEAAVKQIETLLEDAQNDQMLLYHFGNLGSKDARELAQSLKILREIYTRGRYARQILDDERRQWLRRMRTDVKMSLDAPRGVSGPTHAARTEKKQMAKGYALNLMSIHNLLASLFPYSQFAADLSERLISAQRATTRARLNAKDRFEAFLDTRFGTKNRRERNRIIRALHVRKYGWPQVQEIEGKPKTEKLTIEQAQKILAGEMKPGWEQERDTMILLQQAYRDWRAKPARARNATKFIKISRVASRKKPEGLYLSDMDALYLLQLSKQEEYLPALATHGFTEEVIREIRRLIDPRALALGEFYAAEYESNWADMNPVFQRLYHMDMPQIRNYAPGMFENMKDENNVSGDPMGDGKGMSALSFGSTKNRRAHRSRPKQYSAHAVWMAHVDRSTYWVNFAELARDMSMVLRETEVRRAIEARHGMEASAEIKAWIENINNDGAVDAAARLAANTVGQNIAAGQAIAGLAFNLGVPFKQFSAALGSIFKIGPNAAMRAFARAIFRPESFGYVWKSEAIQQRIREGFSPEDRAMLDAAEVNPEILWNLHTYSRLPTSYADALFTTISGVIAYDHHYQESIRGGMSEKQAHELAMQFMDRAVFLTSQPADTQTKSNWEVQLKGLGKLFSLYRSDPRKQIGHLIEAYQLTKQGRMSKAEFSSMVATQWAIYGMLSYVGGSMFRALAHDDDDDRPIWDWKELLVAMLIGPVEGAGFIGSVVQAGIKLFSGSKTYGDSMNPVAENLKRSVSRLKDFDPLDLGDYAALASTFAQVGSMRFPLAGLVPAAMRGAGQVQNMLDNLHESESERLSRLNREFAKAATETAKMEARRVDDFATSDTPLDQVPEEIRAKVARARAKTTITQDGAPEIIQDLRRATEKGRRERIRYMLENLPADEREAFRAELRQYGMPDQ